MPSGPSPKKVFAHYVPWFVISVDNKSAAAHFEIAHGSADNISFFVNVTFPVGGEYVVQTLIDSSLFDERALLVSDQQLIAPAEETSEAVN